MYSTDYHELTNRLMTDLVEHGWGEMIFRTTKVSGEEKVKIEILCGRSYVMFIKKSISLEGKELF